MIGSSQKPGTDTSNMATRLTENEAAMRAVVEAVHRLSVSWHQG